MIERTVPIIPRVDLDSPVFGKVFLSLFLLSSCLVVEVLVVCCFSCDSVLSEFCLPVFVSLVLLVLNSFLSCLPVLLLVLCLFLSLLGCWLLFIDWSDLGFVVLSFGFSGWVVVVEWLSPFNVISVLKIKWRFLLSVFCP